MTDISIAGIGTYLPGQPIVNDESAALDRPITAAELERVGVRTRYRAGAEEGIAEMAAAAARQALRRSGTPATDVDLIVLSNWTQRRYIPEFAPRLKQLLGAERAFAFDICCACAGFLAGVSTASAFLGGRHRLALVVASETTSQRSRPGGRSTLVYSDGAGAAVLRAGTGGPIAVLDTELATLAEHHDIMSVSAEGYVLARVDQRTLTNIASGALGTIISTLLERNGLGLDDVDWIVPHSGTAGVQAKLRGHLGPHADRVLTDLPEVGNLSSASIPVALEHFLRTGPIRPGDTVVAASVGTGFYAAAALLRVAPDTATG